MHLDLQTRVAIKLLGAAAQRAETRDAFLARFLREGKAAARLQSKHVARVIDFGPTEPDVG